MKVKIELAGAPVEVVARLRQAMSVIHGAAPKDPPTFIDHDAPSPAEPPCKEHPSYRALRRPRTPCPGCKRAYRKTVKAKK